MSADPKPVEPADSPDEDRRKRIEVPRAGGGPKYHTKTTERGTR